MVGPPSPIAGIDIRRDDALNCVSCRRRHRARGRRGIEIPATIVVRDPPHVSSSHAILDSVGVGRVFGTAVS
jgi:hypothetical protein